MVRKITYTILFFFLLTFSNYSQWFWQNPSPTANDLLGVDFINELTGWAVGTVGTIIKTTDGGESWEFQNSGISVQFNGVFFLI